MFLYGFKLHTVAILKGLANMHTRTPLTLLLYSLVDLGWITNSYHYRVGQGNMISFPMRGNNLLPATVFHRISW